MEQTTTAEEQTVVLPVKRDDADTLRERLTENAYERILPARYLKRDGDGELIEEQEDLFERVAKNIALAEIAYWNNDISIQESWLRDDMDHRMRVWQGDVIDRNGLRAYVDEDTVKYLDYDAFMAECDHLDDELVEHVETVRHRFQDAMEYLKFMPNSPTLMSAGDTLQQLSACFICHPTDDMHDIYETVKEAALIMKSGGGVGYSFSELRPYGGIVGSTGGIASGPISFMRTYDRMCETIAQGGTRRGAQMGMLNVDHPDIIHFIHAKNKDVSLAETLRLNDPDDFRNNSFGEALEEARTLIENERVPQHLRNAAEGHLSNFNISVVITDEFMEAVKNDTMFEMNNPRTGEAHIATEYTKEMYEWFDMGEYVKVGEPLRIPARELWDRIAEGAWENGEPGVFFVDEANRDHSFDVEKHPEHRIYSTNPCLTGDMSVAVADGRESVPIKQLAEEGEDVPVYTRTEDGGLTVSTGRNPRKTGSDKEIYRVNTDGNASLRLTGDHQVWVNGEGWVEAQDLEPGDSLNILTRYTKMGEERLFHGEEDDQKLAQLASNHRIVSVERDGVEDVYDLTVDEHHNFFAAVDYDEGEEKQTFLNVHNCGEQAMEPYDSCNLGHINLSTLVAEDAPDWRHWKGRHATLTMDNDEVEAYADLEGDIKTFLSESIDWDEFDDRIETGVRFLDNVITMSNYPLEKIEEKTKAMRRIGLGIMGLAQMYIQLGIEYGSPEGNEIARQIMREINWKANEHSHRLAEERGVFPEWKNSKFANLDEYPDWGMRHVGQTTGEYPLRHHVTTTIAPTGTVGMVGNTSGGCEPIYNVAYYKNVSDDVQGDEMLVEFDDYFLRVLEANDIDVEEVQEEALEQMEQNTFEGIDGLKTVPEGISRLFVTAGDLTCLQHAQVLCALQEGVGSSISKTLNAAHDATVEDIQDTMMYAWENGSKALSVYRDGSRTKQVLTTRAENTEVDSSESEDDMAIERNTHDDTTESHRHTDSTSADIDVTPGVEGPETPSQGTPRGRPNVTHGETHKIQTGYGSLYVNINEDSEGPCEVFATVGKSGGLMESMTEALARQISLNLRMGCPLDEIIDQLEDIRSPKFGWDNGHNVKSVPDGIALALKRYKRKSDISQLGILVEDDGFSPEEILEQLPDSLESLEDEDSSLQRTLEEFNGGGLPHGDAQDVCKDCGEYSVVITEGCETCTLCGWKGC